jgi:hypothetical protein
VKKTSKYISQEKLSYTSFYELRGHKLIRYENIEGWANYPILLDKEMHHIHGNLQENEELFKIVTDNLCQL